MKKFDARQLIDEDVALENRALKVLRVIAAEFETDPMSTQCFDQRTVAEAISITKEHTQIQRRCRGKQ